MLLRRKLPFLGIAVSVLLCFTLISSASASSMWSRTYGGTEDDWASSVIATSDGGYAMAGGTWSFGAGGADFWLLKTDTFGNMQWNRTYGETGNEEARSLVAASDGGYAMVGYTSSSGAGGADFWFVKTDGFGNMQWNRTYGGPYSDVAYSIIATSDGGYALAGSTYSLGAGEFDFWFVKTDGFGNMQWNRTYGGPYSDVAYSIIATSDGGYALAGSTNSSRAFWLVKTDGLGNMEWNQTYGGTIGDEALSLVSTSDGGYAIAGYTVTESAGSDFCLVKTDALGNMQWNRTYGGPRSEKARSLVVTSDGGYALAGEAAVYGPGLGGDFLLVKTNALGNMEWNQTYGGTSPDLAYSVITTSDGGYAIAGWTASFGAGGADFWLVKTDESGVVPEYSSWFIPSLVLTATAFIIINKKRSLRTRSQVS